MIEEGLYQPEDRRAEVQAIFNKYKQVLRTTQSNQPDAYIVADGQTAKWGSSASTSTPSNRVTTSRPHDLLVVPNSREQEGLTGNIDL